MKRYGHHALSAAVGVMSIGLLWVGNMSAQTITGAEIVSRPLEIPKGASKPGFDIRRLNSENYGAFEPFYVTSTQPLRTVLNEGKVAGDTRLLVTHTAGGRIALLTDQMAYHHLAQGRDGGKDWMATF